MKLPSLALATGLFLLYVSSASAVPAPKAGYLKVAPATVETVDTRDHRRHRGNLFDQKSHGYKSNSYNSSRRHLSGRHDDGRYSQYSGWHRYGSRPRGWRDRGCIAVGPIWFCP